MKVAVYTIALNEEHFVERWAESCKDADFKFIFDTGSTDDTVMTAAKHGVDIWVGSVKPWRFDDARNASLAMLPDDIDYCIALDMDEVLKPGWRKELEHAFEQGWTRPRYKYVWSWGANGEEGLTYGGDKIHSRHGYRWKHPVHEVLVADRTEEKQGWVGLEIHHHPDSNKSRGQYFPLLKLAVKEDPLDDRNAFYYARELYFHGHYMEAAEEFKRHLSLPKAVWPPERAASLRYLAKCEPENREKWLTKAVEEAGGRREALVELAQHHYHRKQWKECLDAAKLALTIQDKPLDYLCEEFAWGSLPWDLAAIASYWLGDSAAALEYGQKAVEISPEDTRLLNNLTFYMS